MKIAFLTGSYPPDACGVGDYTQRLIGALEKLGASCTPVLRRDWNIGQLRSVLRELDGLRPDLVHLQYPTIGFGAHLTPQVLSLAVAPVVTLHEITQAHILRRLSLYPFSLRSRHIVFTSDFERNYASSWAPWIKGRSSVIPIGSSIPTGADHAVKDLAEVVFFGLLRPDKGLEDVLELARLLHTTGSPIRIRVVGKPHARSTDYFNQMLKRSEHLPVLWNVDLPDADVADILSRTRIAYMPFPDGASERRTSLFALLANGIATVTTRGSSTPENLHEAVRYATDPGQALPMITQLTERPDQVRSLARLARAYMDRRSWPSIAQRHQMLYESLLHAKR